MWIAVAPTWIASPPAMIAAGISTNPFGTIPVKAMVQDDRAAAKPRRKPGANVNRKPVRPMVRIESSTTRIRASELWAKIAIAFSSGPPSPEERTRLEIAGRMTAVGIALVVPAT